VIIEFSTLPSLDVSVQPRVGVTATDPSGAASMAAVLDMLRRDTDLLIRVIEPDWDRVDSTRATFDAAGVSNRAFVHHASALSWHRPTRWSFRSAS